MPRRSGWRGLKALSLGQRRPVTIFVGENGIAIQWPIDGEFRVIPEQAPFKLGIIKIGALVEKVGLFAQDEKTVRKARWNIKLPFI